MTPPKPTDLMLSRKGKGVGVWVGWKTEPFAWSCRHCSVLSIRFMAWLLSLRSPCFLQFGALLLSKQPHFLSLCDLARREEAVAGRGAPSCEWHSFAGWHVGDLCISQEELSFVTPRWDYLSPGMCARNSYAAAAATRSQPWLLFSTASSEQEW